MRNSNCMAIAPTATISNITGVAQSIEPTYKHLFVKSNLSGEFATMNPLEPLMILGETRALQVRADVDEQNAPMITPGKAEVAFLK